MDIKTLIRKRGGKKHSLSAFKTHVTDIENNPNLTIEQITELEQRNDKIEALYHEFLELQSEIEDVCEEGVLEEQYAERDNFEKMYFLMKAKAQVIIDKFKAKNVVGASVSNGSVTGLSDGLINGSNILNHVKLPPIQLPKFSGQYETWQEYRDTFNSIVHTNVRISGIEKMHYLKSSLESQAAQVIQSIEISELNYEVAWKLLCDRYNNKKLLINNHVKALFNISPIKNEGTSNLRKLLDDFSKHLLSLEALGQPVKQWSTLLIYMISNKLDSQTKREWEISRLDEELPTIDELKTFLKGRCELLETLESQANKKHHNLNKPFYKAVESTSTFLTTREARGYMKCNFCDSLQHFIYTCEDFLKLNANDRTIESKKRKLCINCLKKNHFSTECKAGNCRKCQKRHHSLLHYGNDTTTISNNAITSTTQEGDLENSNIISSCGSIITEQVLLSTAIVKVLDKSGNYQFCRALLDCGSQSSFITSEFCKKLNLDTLNVNLKVIGITHSSSNINSKTEIQINSCTYSYATKLSCYVINKITDKIPQKTYEVTAFNIPKHVKLADSSFYKSNNIELLLGANVFWDLICPEKLSLGKNQPMLQRTRLGWVIAGPFVYNHTTTNKTICNFSTTIEIQDQLKTFWELEEVDNTSLSVGESLCESNFVKTTKRDTNGRFIVSIPFKQPTPTLGNSLNTAIKRFSNLERKLQNNNELKQQYTNFMNEYKRLGHMSIIENPYEKLNQSYYLPHHGVLNESSLTTKLRVVFDGSCKTSNGISLNDTQCVGPIIQQELFCILLRFRTHIYVLSADIEKMYRQVLITPQHRDYQRIVWRENCSDPLQHFNLNTVTYGTASAPYLAVKCLQQVGHEYQDKYPNSARVVIEDFYVDDLLTGTNSITEAIKIYREITEILESACYKLRKWVSNNTQIDKEIASIANKESVLEIGDDEYKKTLGLVWAPKSDFLKYKVDGLEFHAGTTKRELLSSISKIFDPLGLIGPCIVTAKIMMQELWLHHLSWDDKIPDDLNKKWNKFKRDLLQLNQIQIPRHVPCSNCIRLELHAFSDASNAAYGTCIYIRAISDTNISTNLLCSKARVAPIKKITIPKLELCGALLSARLVSKVLASLNIKFNGITFWCDSTIVLNWIRMPPSNLKVFVAHRVAEIQKTTNINNWNYVNTADNPADLVSRGADAKNLIESIWWNGPNWLSVPDNQWPISHVENKECNIPEIKNATLTFSASTQQKINIFPFNYTSSFIKLQRIVAWCLRFINNCKLVNNKRQLGNLTSSEYEQATRRLVRLSQEETFSHELRCLRSSKNKFKGNFMRLSPFLDQEGLIRVGGRLKNSNFSYNKKHPLLLSGKHILSKVIMENEHVRLLHAGPQLTLASLRERFWLTASKRLAKAVVYNCIKCYRAKPTQNYQFMGDLPKHRLTALYPFYAVGVDYAGPFLIKSQRGRGAKTKKCYICLFVCFATKALHLEPVTELTSEAFIATFRRFVARRGRPSHIYSDNGTNFVGATSELKELGKFLIKNNSKLSSVIAKENVTWHFIPPNSPHFGGLWEAGVKSVKHHLKRVIGNALVVFEDFLTILVQIEGVLNSRPLHPLSSSPDDYEALTPSHFLISRSSMALPDPDITGIQLNRLSQFQHLQQLLQHFWKRWSQEYVSELQERTKWNKRLQNVNVGDLVIVKDDNLPPLRWKLGRIIETHSGSDGAVRVVSVKTSSSVIKRSTAKICLLPISETPTTADTAIA